LIYSVIARTAFGKFKLNDGDVENVIGIKDNVDITFN